MKIEVLYSSGCPNHAPAAERVQEALRQERVSVDILEVEVNDFAAAQRAGFLGSPTIRINGQDIEKTARSSQAFGLACRTYIDRGARSGVPPLEWIRAAIREAGGLK